jgi:hypothetical protein
MGLRAAIVPLVLLMSAPVLAREGSAASTGTHHSGLELATHPAGVGSDAGFDVVALPPGGRLKRIGVHVGDEIVRVNGHDFATPGETVAAYRALTAKADPLRIELVRAGTRRIIDSELPVAVTRAAPRDEVPDTVGPWRAGVQLGPGAGLMNARGGAFGMGFQFGYDLLTHSRHHLYLDPLDLFLTVSSPSTGLTLAPHLIGDISVSRRHPLYVTPSFGLGLGLGFPSEPTIPTTTAFVFGFGVGVRYILDSRWDFTFAPLNISVVPAGTSTAAFQVPQISYWLSLGAGIHF